MAYGEISLEIQEEVQFVSLNRFHEEIDSVKSDFKIVRSQTVRAEFPYDGLYRNFGLSRNKQGCVDGIIQFLN